jgi:hypothetical protein
VLNKSRGVADKEQLVDWKGGWGPLRIKIINKEKYYGIPNSASDFSGLFCAVPAKENVWGCFLS